MTLNQSCIMQVYTKCCALPFGSCKCLTIFSNTPVLNAEWPKVLLALRQYTRQFLIAETAHPLPCACRYHKHTAACQERRCPISHPIFMGSPCVTAAVGTLHGYRYGGELSINSRYWLTKLVQRTSQVISVVVRFCTFRYAFYVHPRSAHWQYRPPGKSNSPDVLFRKQLQLSATVSRWTPNPAAAFLNFNLNLKQCYSIPFLCPKLFVGAPVVNALRRCMI
jgi:hypothetical protein